MNASPALTDVKEVALRSLNKLPPFSPTLNRLLGTLSREDTSFAQIADLLEKDTVLTGSVLALVNSAAYGTRARVSSVRQAVSMLGIVKLRNAALSMSITRLWDKVRTPRGWSMASFNQHSIGTALLADLLCQETDVCYPEGAFTAGLLHDLGKLLLAVGLPDVYEQIERSGRSEEECSGINHAVLSAEALRLWNVPEPIETAVRFHHDPAADPTPLAPGQLALSRVIFAADRYLRSAGVECFENLEIDAKIPSILKTFEPEFESLRSFF